MTEQEITQYLVKKYQPHAILLYGSRVSGVEVPSETDWDVSVICQSPDAVVSERIGEVRLDASGMAIDEKTCLGGAGTPCLPMRVLYDDGLGLGCRVVENNQKIFDAGPKPLREEDIADRSHHIERLTDKLAKRIGDPITSLVYKGNIVNFACRYWCELRQVWSLAPYRVVPMIEQNDPALAVLLKALNGPDAVQAARAIHAHLFGDLK